jgi:hypothetical protein
MTVKRQLPKHHQDLVERTRAFKTYAQPGEEVTCTNGHVICVVRKEISIAAKVRLEYFHHWTQQTPAIGETAKDCACVKCGARWFMGTGLNTHLHFAKGGWR